MGLFFYRKYRDAFDRLVFDFSDRSQFTDESGSPRRVSLVIPGTETIDVPTEVEAVRSPVRRTTAHEYFNRKPA